MTEKNNCNLSWLANNYNAYVRSTRQFFLAYTVLVSADLHATVPAAILSSTYTSTSYVIPIIICVYILYMRQ